MFIVKILDFIFNDFVIHFSWYFLSKLKLKTDEIENYIVQYV